jgi:hypothetical protein
MDDKTPTPETAISEPDYSMKDLDEETIEILIEDMIATGG